MPLSLTAKPSVPSSISYEKIEEDETVALSLQACSNGDPVGVDGDGNAPTSGSKIRSRSCWSQLLIREIEEVKSLSVSAPSLTRKRKRTGSLMIPFKDSVQFR
mmetsp:Transcript_23958/g.53340  ORF Transcript_23958/g.53340 Transcript_23958/m.53340 type:complete len:103 (+) Transcript_23958:683-991(+)